MHALELICYILAAVCFAFAALGVAPDRVNLLALGLLAWVIVPLAHTIH